MKLLRNVDVFRSGTRSRWTALVAQQVYKYSHTLGFSCSLT